MGLPQRSETLRISPTSTSPVRTSRPLGPDRLAHLGARTHTGADVIAAGAVHSVATCGGPVIPFRGGRVDTFEAGGFGTPEPHQDIETIQRSFTMAGFSQSEMIKLVACGHTMGGVRSDAFPQLVPVPEAGGLGIHDFDTTPTFDNKV